MQGWQGWDSEGKVGGGSCVEQTHERADSGVDGEVYLQNVYGLPDLERAHGAQRVAASGHAALRDQP